MDLLSGETTLSEIFASHNSRAFSETKELTAMGNKFFSFREDPMFRGSCTRKQTGQIIELVSLE